MKNNAFRLMATALVVVIGFSINTTKAEAHSLPTTHHYQTNGYYESAYTGGFNDPLIENTGVYNPLTWLPAGGSAITYVPPISSYGYDYSYQYPVTTTTNSYYPAPTYNTAPTYNAYPVTEPTQYYPDQNYYSTTPTYGTPVTYPTYDTGSTTTYTGTTTTNTTTDTGTTDQSGGGSGYSF